MNLVMLIVALVGVELKMGIFSGEVVDAASRQPLPGVNVILPGTELGAATDEYGRYVISEVPAGEHSIEVSMLGYRTQVLTRVRAMPGRTVFQSFKLEQEAIGVSGVTVRPEYFVKDEASTASEVRLNYHEMRTNPEGYNVIRAVAALPGVATGFDFSSEISIRGGDPDENLTVIDNLPVPYPVHFPSLGGGMGQASIVSVETVDEVEFSPGGYSARYGEKLSSLMAITLRDGNQDRFEAMVDLNMSAVGLSVEGPVGDRFNYIFAYRRSFLELVDLVADIGDVVPSFDDFYLRLAYKPSLNHKIWGFAIQSLDRMQVPGQGFGVPQRDLSWRGYQTIAGINWRMLMGDFGFSTLTLGGTNLENRMFSLDTLTDDEVGHYIPHETHFYLSEALTFNPWTGHEFQTGVLGSFSLGNYEYWQAAYIGPGGTEVPGEGDTTSGSWFTVSPYLQYVWTPWRWLKVAPGIRFSYNTLNSELWLEPRAGLAISPFRTTTINLSCGTYHQLHDYDIMLERPEVVAKGATHYIAGVEQLVRDDLKLTLEGYYKDLKHLLFYNDAESKYVADETGNSYGLEFLAQKKMGKFLQGQFSYSLAFSERTNSDDGTFPADWDIRHILTLVGGVKFLKNFEFSVKYRYASGMPWTPYDTANAYFNPQDSLWYVDRVDARASGRLPDYSRLDLQISHTSYTKKGIMISGYFNLQNAFNHSNIVSYSWDGENKELKPSYNFFITPVGGVTIKF